MTTKVATVLPVQRYRLEWRYRWTAAEGGAREVTRAREVAGSIALKDNVANLAAEAVDREFMVSVVGTGTAVPPEPICLRAEEVAAWSPGPAGLPRPVSQTWWPDDRDLCADRYRLLVIVTDAFAEARSLRLVGRRRSRMLLARCREALLGG